MRCLPWVPPLSPVYLGANLRAPEVPRAHARGPVRAVREAALLLVERSDRSLSAEGRGPVLDAGVDLGVDGAEHRGLECWPAGDAPVRAHEHDVPLAYDLCECHSLRA